MLKNTRKLVVFMLIAIVVFALANFVLAADVETELGLEYGAEIGLSDTDPRLVAAGVIQVALGFLGIIAVIIIMYAGWVWMTSEGNEEKISQAKKILINAVIGLTIILSAFAIASFILNRLNGAINEGVSYSGGGGIPGQGGISAASNKIIESHYPSRNQTNVPRNTRIIVTFKEAIDSSTVIMPTKDAEGNIIKGNVKIYRSVDGPDHSLSASAIVITKTDDNKTFVFNTISSPDYCLDNMGVVSVNS